jgi:hypothetical protein
MGPQHTHTLAGTHMGPAPQAGAGRGQEPSQPGTGGEGPVTDVKELQAII